MSSRRAQPGRQPVDEEPPEGARFPADVLADNLRAYRLLRRLEQQDVAARLNELGHPWRRITVSEVERGAAERQRRRAVGAGRGPAPPVEQLLDPRGPEGIDGATLALTSRGADPSLEVEPGEVHGLICAGADRPVLATLAGMIGWTR